VGHERVSTAPSAEDGATIARMGDTDPQHSQAPADEVLDRNTRALTALLQRFPQARVAAIGGRASAILVPVPASLPLGDHPVLTASSMLDVVVPVDRVVIAKLWGQARSQAIACGQIRMIERPEQPCMVYVVDVRSVHGVMIAILAEGRAERETEDPVLEAVRLPPLPPRFARVTKDASARLIGADEEVTQLVGWTIDELRGRRTLEFIHPEDQELAVANWMEMLSRPAVARRVRLRHQHRDGWWVWLEITNHNRLDDPEHGDVLADMIDISEEMAAQDALRAREQLLGQLAETVPLGLFHIDRAGSLLFANETLGRITGVALGSRLRDQLRRVVPHERSMVDGAVNEALAGTARDLVIAIQPEDDGDIRHCRLRMLPLVAPTGAVNGVTGCIEDISDSVRMSRELETRARTDQLTGCLNHAAVLERLDEVLRAAGRERRRARRSGTAVVFVDLDHFKSVNDRLGHAAGDRVLVGVAERLRGSVRGDDAVGRLGGDEFLVICPGVHSAVDAARIARTIAARVHHETYLGGTLVEVRASVGVSWTDDPDADADRIVATADSAMYDAKRSGDGVPVLA
jgi:diguanylate cyclase (GGDEF)-like protein/PAS domain S-box-containing protein